MPRAGPRESLSFQPIQCVPIGFLGKSSTARGFNMFQPSMVGENFVDTPWFHQLRGRKLPDHRSQHSVYPATVSTSVQADVPDVSCYPRSSEFQIETIPKSQNKWQYHNKSHRIQSYGIYANIGGILMVNGTPYMAYIQILWVLLRSPVAECPAVDSPRFGPAGPDSRRTRRRSDDAAACGGDVK